MTGNEIAFYPQWFVGGPWHGKDMFTETGSSEPYPHNTIQVPEYDPPLVEPTVDLAAVTLHVRTYRWRRFQLGPVPLTVWVLDGMDDARAEAELIDIILKPHVRRVSLETRE